MRWLCAAEDFGNRLACLGLPVQARAILERVRGTKAVDAEFDDIKLAAQVANSVRRWPLEMFPCSSGSHLEPQEHHSLPAKHALLQLSLGA